MTGLGTKGNLKALVVKDGAKVGETTKDGAMEWPEGAELWVLKGKTTVEIDSSGLLIPTTTWDETEAGVTSRMMRMAQPRVREPISLSAVMRATPPSSLGMKSSILSK